MGDKSHRTAKAIAYLRANYAKPLRVEELPEVARMGISTLHHHFRALTAMIDATSPEAPPTPPPPTQPESPFNTVINWIKSSTQGKE